MSLTALSLRTRLFLILAGLVAALVVAQWWLMTSLSRALDRELDSVALAVSGSVASFFTADPATSGHVTVVDRTLRPGELVFPPDAVANADLPDPEELLQFIDNERVKDQLHSVVVRRVLSFDSSSDAAAADGSSDDASPLPGSGDPRAHVRAKWRVETLQPDEHGVMTYEFVDDGSGDSGRARQLFVPDEVLHGDGTVVVHARADGQGGEDASDDGPVPTDVRIHIERQPDERFLWLVSPGSRARVPLPEARLDAKIEDFRRSMLLGSGLVLALGLLLAGAVAHRVSAPLRRLATAAGEVGDGAFGTQVDESAGDRELASTLGAFNRMSSRLAELDGRARKLSALRHLGEIGDVARGLAHTLRNPLNALGLSVEELASRAAESDPQGAGALAESARRQVQRMDRGIRSFLVLASPGGGAIRRLDVGDLARDVALEALQDGGGRVRVQAEVAEGPVALSGVEAELRAVLQALVVNAVEASADGAEVQVRVGPADDASLRVEVLDRGPGLAAEVRKRLFTPHVSTKSNGSGMGLFLAHRLATERYGGSLELLDRADEGGGTRVVLTLGDRLDTESEA